MASGQFLTDIIVVSGKDKCPQGYTILNATINGQDANLYEGSFLKGGERYLCFARIQNSPTIVTDLNIVKDRDSIPVGFTAIKNCFNDSSEKALRKHVLCLKKDSIRTAASGVVNIVAIQLSKGEKFQGNLYTISNEVNGLNVGFQTVPNSNVRQPPSYNSAMKYRPPNVQSGYSGSNQPLPYPSGQHHVMPVPISLQGTAPPTHNQPSSPSNKHISAIHGVLFQVNPKFEMLWKKPKSDKIVSARTLDDIERNYGYTFEKEQSILSSR
ncbi:uncharacterized protein LOC114533631 [Dendronephthya gigantea]|uniref:uncharacterized protein LOC114533631 n=1 Tax=Dendronephthya gigantea TaxID=151771 RepID=UPI00106A805C|nr:uncharacterized protein LOC114533631 [Dendronephthya gigantea]